MPGVERGPIPRVKLPETFFPERILTALAMASALFSCLSLVPIALLRIRPLPVAGSAQPGPGSGG